MPDLLLVHRIDALLPQTQCGKCGHPGCEPYAQGIAAGEAINKCPPGGQETVQALSALLGRPTMAVDTTRGLAPPQTAFIREAECIGCTKCIQACPVDAIMGAAKLMHTVITAECTGCDLCVAPCPVDCIDMLPLPSDVMPPVVAGFADNDAALEARSARRARARRRFEQRNARLAQAKQARRQPQAPGPEPTSAAALPTPEALQTAVQRVRAQKAAAAESELKKARSAVSMSRAQLYKSLKAFGSPPTATQHSCLSALQLELDAAEAALKRLIAGANPPTDERGR